MRMNSKVIFLILLILFEGGVPHLKRLDLL